MTQSAKLRWGVLGAAGIARGSVIPGLLRSQLNEVKALASRDRDKARRTADEFGIEAAYGSYEELLSDDSIEAVYIPLPNHLHREWTIRALEAGKHVLCEKPLALTAAEAEEMALAAQKAGRQLAEAFMYRHHPRYAMIREVIASGEIGDLRSLHGTFTFNSSGSSGNVRFVKEWGGGGLYDVGCYPISVARMLIGAEPEAVTARALFSPEHGGVDMMASGLLEFPGGLGVTFDCGMWGAFRNKLEVLGTDGILEVPSAFMAGLEGETGFYVTTGSGRRYVDVPQVDHFSLEADDFARTVLHGEPQRFPPQDAVAGMRVLEACLRSAEQRVRIELPSCGAGSAEAAAAGALESKGVE
ncbi:Gfo/Idh/MocA family protein [Paenibacillus pasadenensis]|uniref:Oxidoreductase n=1 Tax=Paenibacillus pasadenensis TaxID=217090 RepID=A0A2N5N8E6_9BACL|nr:MULTISPECIES: Gfo/Idh/MocA family oxidoreductase [Paenibacillus]PLT46612.1 oxidoreductase [Paenibacillus pasadenensis]QGG57002.1 gfo/Idh/MocA family oxidoreductase [Paenibacillus sp. B01]